VVLPYVQKLLGHFSIQMAMIYYHLTPQHLKKNKKSKILGINNFFKNIIQPNQCLEIAGFCKQKPIKLKPYLD